MRNLLLATRYPPLEKAWPMTSFGFLQRGILHSKRRLANYRFAVFVTCHLEFQACAVDDEN
jgi:hypothetical protein